MRFLMDSISQLWTLRKKATELFADPAFDGEPVQVMNRYLMPPQSFRRVGRYYR